jgi:hypothetical protein
LRTIPSCFALLSCFRSLASLTSQIPLASEERFWSPPDAPGCNGKALMHASPMAKRYLETVKFRGPPAGTGPIVFRALIKQVSSIKMPRTVLACASGLGLQPRETQGACLCTASDPLI